jgi:predicted metal-binding protein
MADDAGPAAMAPVTVDLLTAGAPAAVGTATLFVCMACAAKELGGEKPGPLLLAAVQERLAAALAGEGAIATQLTIAPVECLAVCKRPATVALAGPGKWTYVVGDLDPALHAPEVLAAALAYAATTDGIVPWRERPQTFRKGVISRIPPLGFVQPEAVA